MRWFGLFIAAVLVLAISSVNADVWEEDEHEVLIRNERGTKNRGKSKYISGSLEVVRNYDFLAVYKITSG